MKLLLDECQPVDFRHSLPEHDAHTAEWARLKELKNGELLRFRPGSRLPGPADRGPEHSAPAAQRREDNFNPHVPLPIQPARRPDSTNQLGTEGSENDRTRPNDIGSPAAMTRMGC